MTPIAIQPPARHTGMRWEDSLGTPDTPGSFPHLRPLMHTPTPPLFCTHHCSRQGPAASLLISQGKAVWWREQNSPRDSRIFP